MSQPIIEIKNLKYTYSAEEKNNIALSGIDLSINRGEYVAVIGPNGSGKTTLLKHCNALLKPTSGEVMVNGLNTAVEGNSCEIRRLCGMIFQNPDNQLVATTVEEDVAFGLENMAVPPGEIRRKVSAALELLGLSRIATFPPHLLSGGEKQRVAIAGILAMEPRCLLMDEPTAMLDPASQSEVMQAVTHLNRELGITVLHVTHAPEESARSDRVLVMDKGSIRKDGTPGNVLTDLALLHRLGLESTAGAELAALLREEGLEMPRELIHGREIVEAICSSRQKT